MSALNRQITEAIRRPSPSALAASSIGFGGLALYLYLRSKTSTVGTDMLDILTFVKWKREIAKKTKGDWSVGDTWEERVASDPSKIALHFIDENKSYTFKEVNEKANQVAHWGLAEGLKQGDVVALMMENRPEFIFTWLGLIKIGVCLSLINTNLTGKPLIHSLSVCGATHAIIGGEYARSIVEVRDSVGDKITGKWFSVTGSIPGHISLDSLLASQSTTNPPRSVRNKTNSSSPMFYIYTSGTTGHPKASVIKHLRFFVVAMAFSEIYKVRKPDRVYCCLPLYHSAGGIVGVGFTVYSGCTFVFRRKFSASSFWKDICENNCTVFQYIGELCRYLLAQPETEYDSKHKVRVCIGNGMRPDVWQQFEKRFQVGQIGEFYGATEGNANMANSRGKYAAVGYISPLFAPLFPIKLVRFDIESEQPIRGKDGLCIPCRDGEVGELLGAIDHNDPLRSFDGYTDKEATNKKILRDVFTKGDAWFRTGDLLRKDSEGFFYFVDRIGDTFRWKGENVATGEIAEVVSAIAGVEEANIYGVAIPGFDGRAGMACIVIDKSQFNFDNFYTVTKAQLPSYAQPIFIRVQPAIEITSTFKHKKADLQKEGFNPSEISDELYFRDTEKGAYVPLTNDLYNQIVSGQKSKL